MDKNEKQIIVVENKILFGGDYFQGFRPGTEIDYESRILSNIKIMKRGLAEKDSYHKQPIGYIIVINPKTKQVFAYQRASEIKLVEERLQGKWSWGVGGHIEPLDINNKNLIRESMLRELSEEIGLETKNYPKILGYINDDNDDVGKVHFGLLYVLETSENIKPKDGEMASGRFVSLGELEKICSSPDSQVEAWSKIAMGPLKKLFEVSKRL